MSFFWKQDQAMTLSLTGQHMGCSWEAAPEPASPPTLQSAVPGLGTLEPPTAGSYLSFGLCLDQSPTKASLVVGTTCHTQQMDREEKGANSSGRVLWKRPSNYAWLSTCSGH